MSQIASDITHITTLVAANKGDDDTILVSSLVPIYCIHLHPSTPHILTPPLGEESFRYHHLLVSVWGDDTNTGHRNTTLKKEKEESQQPFCEDN